MLLLLIIPNTILKVINFSQSYPPKIPGYPPPSVGGTGLVLKCCVVRTHKRDVHLLCVMVMVVMSVLLLLLLLHMLLHRLLLLLR